MMRFRTTLLTATAVAPVLFGCTSVTGLGGSSSYSCQAPEGVTCNSVSGVYANAVRDNLPTQRQAAQRSRATSTESPSAGRRSHSTAVSDEAEALRAPPRILRLWFKPWEDADHDLYDQGYVYVQVDAGQWRIDHVRRRIRDGFAPVKPPQRVDDTESNVTRKSDGRLSPDVSQTPRPLPSPVPSVRGE